jgi:hypothetical protein
VTRVAFVKHFLAIKPMLAAMSRVSSETKFWRVFPITGMTDFVLVPVLLL